MSDYTNLKYFAITASGFENPDYVLAISEDDAILEWAKNIVEVSVTEIEED